MSKDLSLEELLEQNLDKALDRELVVDLYVSLVKQRQKIEAQLKELKKIVELNKIKGLLRKNTNLSFKAEDKSKLPLELLSLNQAAVRAVYDSALGGEGFLKKYGLKVDSKEHTSWVSSVGVRVTKKEEDK